MAGIVYLAVLGAALIGAVILLTSPRDHAPTKISPPPHESATARAAGLRAGEDFGRYWKAGAGHPKTFAMPAVARARWEADGQAFEPAAWQSGFLEGFERGYFAKP